ncbi:IS701 family transposase [Actinosynnema sp. NPDC059335]|uniref:IS701 family transposase n=1 Tax=Actinosynnema sp. NPDC059335 TaxID=3346804 RepID=UPI00366E2F17
MTRQVELDREWLAEDAAELCERVFASLARRSQRRAGELYVRGLLAAEGRKSMRNLASQLGRPAAEQSLHHFVSNSPWDWQQVRRALAEHLDRTVKPIAWVVDSMAITKSGRHSVGVQNAFVRHLGRVANSQHAYGVWLAAEHTSYPVNWRLALPDSWLNDPVRRRRAAIPAHLSSATPGSCKLNAALEVADGWDVQPRPLVLDARDADAEALIAQLRLREVSFVMRVDASVNVVADLADNRRVRTTLRSLRPALHPLRQPVAPDPSHRFRLCATADVAVPGDPARSGRLVLLAVWPPDGNGLPQLWLSDLTDLSSAGLLRLARRLDRVRQDVAEVSSQVGIEDFTGRSFAGWHRHITLVSVAHAILMPANACSRAPELLVAGRSS